jgi:choline-sulfatase
MANLPDILVFMTDQHTPYYSGFYGTCAETPNLNQLCAEGTNFTEAYTVCPLCVPARLSMLSAVRPAKNGIFLFGVLPDATPTFPHHLVAQGYETTLVGRMHFEGKNQQHGFVHRLAGDITPVTFNRPKTMANDQGVFNSTFSGPGATQFAGGGYSPVCAYDEFVIEKALEYLSQPHEKPQFIMVSIYAPHFPYVAPKELFEKYRNRVQLPPSWQDDVDHEVIRHYRQPEIRKEIALASLAAYCGLIENMDRQFGRAREAFDRFAAGRNNGKLIGYLSDHGDQCGDRKIYGKETFYEKSAKIPMIFAGEGVRSGLTVDVPFSIMDFGSTLLEYTGASPMDDVDGISMAGALSGAPINPHPVICEYLEQTDGGHFFQGYKENSTYCHGVMVKTGRYKYITYQGFEDEDSLYDTFSDPNERDNLAKTQPQMLKEMRETAAPLLLHQEAVFRQRKQGRIANLMKKFEAAEGIEDGALRWRGNPEEIARYPEICIMADTVEEKKHT